MNAKQIISFLAFPFRGVAHGGVAVGLTLRNVFFCGVTVLIPAAGCLCRARRALRRAFCGNATLQFGDNEEGKHSFFPIFLLPTQKTRLCIVTALLTEDGHVTRWSPHSL